MILSNSRDLTALQVILVLIFRSPVVEAVNCDQGKQYIVTKNGQPVACRDCPVCMLGEEPPKICGSTIDDLTSDQCKNCDPGTYSSQIGIEQCKPCKHPKCLKHEIVNGTCDRFNDTKRCSGICVAGYIMNGSKTACEIISSIAPDQEISRRDKNSSKPTTQTNYTQAEQLSTLSKQFSFTILQTKELTTKHSPGQRSSHKDVSLTITVVVLSVVGFLLFAVPPVVVIWKCRQIDGQSSSIFYVNYDPASSQTSSTSISKTDGVIVVVNSEQNDSNLAGKEFMLETTQCDLYCQESHLDQNLHHQEQNESQATVSLAGRSATHDGSSLAHFSVSEITPTRKGTKDPSNQVTTKDINYIANDIAGVWKPLGRELGLSENTLIRVDHDYKCEYEKCYQTLLKWTQAKVSQANYRALSIGFAHPAVNRPDLIEKYC